jgi:O-antigen/teichoic acid export membrane protein
MDDREGETALVTASLAMAVMALLFALVVTAIAAVMLYYLVKLRREVKRLRYSGELSPLHLSFAVLLFSS